MTILSDDTFLLYAAKHYSNPGCESLDEFNRDLKRFKYIKRLLKRYDKTGLLSERLILNHLILLHNVFNEALVPMLFNKFEKDFWHQIKPFLIYLNYLPGKYQISQDTNEVDIPLDSGIVTKLRQI
jgi:hypothetical protein